MTDVSKSNDLLARFACLFAGALWVFSGYLCEPSRKPASMGFGHRSFGLAFPPVVLFR